MISTGKCSLIIRGDKLKVEDIEDKLNIKHSRLFKKGDVISKVIGECEWDTWIYEKKKISDELPNDSLKGLLESISVSKDYLQTLGKDASITIKLYIQSEFAQMSFRLCPKTLKELASMNIEFEVSILSWGRVESDEE